MHMRWILAAGAALLLSASTASHAAVIPIDDLHFRYSGAWRVTGSNSLHGLAGSSVRFRFAGTVRALVDSPTDTVALVHVSVDHQVVFEGPCNGPLLLRSSQRSSEAEIGVVAARKEGNWRMGTPPGLTWSGIELQDEAFIEPMPSPGFPRPLVWLGDSIMTGVAIGGRHGGELTHDNAMKAFPWIVAHHIDAPSYLVARPGASVRELSSVWRDSLKSFPTRPGEEPLVIVNSGANDIRTPVPIFQKQFEELLAEIRMECPNSDILLLNFFRSRPDRSDTLIRLTKSTGTSHVQFLDVRRDLTGYSDRGVHPDPASHAALAAELSAWAMLHGVRHE